MLGDNDNDDDVIEEAPVSITTAISKSTARIPVSNSIYGIRNFEL